MSRRQRSPNAPSPCWGTAQHTFNGAGGSSLASTRRYTRWPTKKRSSLKLLHYRVLHKARMRGYVPHIERATPHVSGRRCNAQKQSGGGTGRARMLITQLYTCYALLLRWQRRFREESSENKVNRRLVL